MAKWVKRAGENAGWQNQRLIDQSRHETGVSEITVSLRYDFTTKHATETAHGKEKSRYSPAHENKTNAETGEQNFVGRIDSDELTD